jgi:hypothetical protein
MVMNILKQNNEQIQRMVTSHTQTNKQTNTEWVSSVLL